MRDWSTGNGYVEPRRVSGGRQNRLLPPNYVDGRHVEEGVIYSECHIDSGLWTDRREPTRGTQEGRRRAHMPHRRRGHNLETRQEFQALVS